MNLASVLILVPLVPPCTLTNILQYVFLSNQYVVSGTYLLTLRRRMPNGVLVTENAHSTVFFLNFRALTDTLFVNYTVILQ